jgi:hypothetical protein
MATLAYRHWHEGLDPERCISVDGGAPGRLHISHWPGNRTPERFRHVLSTGGCLRLAGAEDRAELLRGLEFVTNNHWDTDGVCSVFACLQPELALRYAPLLLDAASAGDYDRFATPEGLKLELTLTALTRHPDSPVHSKRFEDELERRQAQYDYALDALPGLLEDQDAHLAWIEPELRQIYADLRALREDDIAVEALPELELAILEAEQSVHPKAIQTGIGADRVLELQTTSVGVSATLRLSTRSWFDRTDRVPRPGWGPLKADLEAIGSVEADAESLPNPVLRYAGAAPASEVRARVVAFYRAYGSDVG